MTAHNDWNYERYRTRDLLLEYDSSIMPPHPRAGGLPMIYPWETTSLEILQHNLYLLALQNSFSGTEDDFQQHFKDYINAHDIIFSTYDNFPIEGNNNQLYFDLENNNIYVWDYEYIPIDDTLILKGILIGDNISK